MPPLSHGGDLLAMQAISGYDASQLLDFSVNVRPEGPPDFIRNALQDAMAQLAAYPSPHAEEALYAASRYHDLPASRFAFGNGSNELIHVLARALKKQGTNIAYIVEPAFSEYALACELAGIKVRRIWGGIRLPHDSVGLEAVDAKQEIIDLLARAPEGAAVFFANPGNPAGQFRRPEECLELMRERQDLYWIVDEAFIEYVGPQEDVSVIRGLPPNGVVLRSLTKFHAVPGVRLGYLVAGEALAKAVRAEIPVWSVNAFALAAAVAVFEDTSYFADKTRADNIARRTDLAERLSDVPGVVVMPSVANYLLFRCAGAPERLRDILLKKYAIAVRDCSNYYRLGDGTWFRAAVRIPMEHARLAGALRDILEE